MLEEGLSKPTFNPAEAAQAFLTFVRFELPEGGAAAEERFFRLFGLLNDRLFGPLDLKEGEEQFRHEIGGWLSFQNRWRVPSRSSSLSSRRSSTSSAGSVGSSPGSRHHYSRTKTTGFSKQPPLESDPVVQLLCGVESLNSKDQLQTLIEAISTESVHRPGVRFQFPFQALPKATQDLMSSLMRPVPIDGKPVEPGSNGANLVALLSVPIRDQHEIRRYLATQHSTASSPHPSNIPLAFGAGGRLQSPLLRMPNKAPTTGASPATAQEGVKKPETEIPHLMLSMLEIYLLHFIRFPTAAPKPATPVPQGRPSSRSSSSRAIYRQSSSSGPFGEQVYVHLFKCYLRHFIPHGKTIKSSREYVGMPAIQKEGELFLRFVCELWLSTPTLVPISTAMSTALEIRQRDNDPSTRFDLKDMYGMIKSTYVKPVPSVQKGLTSLVQHLMKDHHIRLAVKDCVGVAQNVGSDYGSDSPPDLPWCLTPAMTLLQQTIYKFFCSTLRDAAIHDVNSSFFSCLEAWLMWLEPWNLELRKRVKNSSRSSSTASNMLTMAAAASTGNKEQIELYPVLKIHSASRSRYKPEWEPYLAANLHFYTVPLALFLKRARELDFSKSGIYKTSHGVVQRVLRVYSPQMVLTIKALLEDPQKHLYSKLLQRHNSLLGEFSPAHLGPQLTLSSLQTDMHNLLEEIYIQYLKKVRDRDIVDRMEASIGEFFTWINLSSPSGGEERDIQQFVEKARVLVDLPLDYEIMPRSNSTSTARSMLGAAPLLVPERDEHGLLTQRGREQLVNGEVGCSPLDVVFHGDTMRSRRRTHEIAFLVPWLIRFSDWLNEKVGLVPVTETESSVQTDEVINEWEPEGSVLNKLLQEEAASRMPWCRINLRFLADYRNILFILVATWYWKKWYNFVVYMLANGTEDGKIFFLGGVAAVLYLVFALLLRTTRTEGEDY